MEEKWITGYEGLYAITRDGKVIKYGSTSSHCLKTYRGEGKYRTVNLSKNGVSKMFYVHMLVAEAFVPKPVFKDDERLVVKFFDGNKSNAVASNLLWEVQNTISTPARVSSRTCKQVNKYDLKGNYIATYNSAAEAHISVGQEGKRGIYQALRGNGGRRKEGSGRVQDDRRKSCRYAYGYLWTYKGENLTEEDIAPYRVVYMCDWQGKIENTFDNLGEATKCLLKSNVAASQSEVLEAYRNKDYSLGHYIIDAIEYENWLVKHTQWLINIREQELMNNEQTNE